MTDVVGAALVLLEFAVNLAFLVSIPICFLKGKTRIGWFGIGLLAASILAIFVLFRSIPDEPTVAFDTWLTATRLVIVALSLVVIVAAVRPAEPGSRWSRKRARSVNGPWRRIFMIAGCLPS